MTSDMDESNISKLSMNDGFDIPQIGLVAFRNDSKEQTKALVYSLLDQGVRHLEVSELFGNGHIIVECCLIDRGIPREECFFTLKIWPKHRKSKSLISAVKDSLTHLGLQYVDLVLLHAPIDISDATEQWKALESLKNEGLVKSIGLANVSIIYLSDLIKNCTIPPAVVQVEVTPFGTRPDIMEFCLDNSIVVLCNEPLAKGIKRKDYVLTAIAEELGTHPDRILIRWVTSKGYAVLVPSTGNPNADDSDVLVPLPADVMTRLAGLEEDLRTTWDTKEDTGDDNY